MILSEVVGRNGSVRNFQKPLMICWRRAWEQQPEEGARWAGLSPAGLSPLPSFTSHTWASHPSPNPFSVMYLSTLPMALPGGASGKEPTCQCKRQTHVWSLGWENPLEKEMATHSSILPGESHGQRNLAGFHRVAQSETRLKWLSTLAPPLYNAPACVAEARVTSGDPCG